MLDVHHEGCLTPFTVKYFFRDVVRRLQENGYEGVNIEDVKVGRKLLFKRTILSTTFYQPMLVMNDAG